MTKTQLLGLTQAELVSFVEQIGQPSFRGRQIFARFTTTPARFAEMTDLPKELRNQLEVLSLRQLSRSNLVTCLQTARDAI